MTTQHLIIIRGNSGSGKTTVASALRGAMREVFGQSNTMLVSQDVIRHIILDGKGASPNQSLDLIYEICQNGMKYGQNVILEGILELPKYGEMLNRIIAEWRGDVHVYYYDVPLEVTLERHDTRPQKELFTKDDMRDWYNSDNKLNVPNEWLFDESVSIDKAVRQMLADCTEGTYWDYVIVPV